jgi:hypothetical protein
MINGMINESGAVPPVAKSAWPWVLYIACLLLFLEVSLQSFYRFTTGTYLYVRGKPALFESDPFSGWIFVGLI